MSKTDYTKVEEALDEGLRKMKVGKLLDIADEASGVKKKEELGESPLQQQQKQLLTTLHYSLVYLRKQKKDPFDKSPFNKNEIITLLKNPDTISQEEWDKLEAFKKHVNAFKLSLEKGGPEKFDETLVEKQRKEQINKRFNVNDKWLPLQ